MHPCDLHGLLMNFWSTAVAINYLFLLQPIQHCNSTVYFCVKYFQNKSYRVMWSHSREINFKLFTIFRNLLFYPEVLWCSGALVFYYVIRVHTKIRIDPDAFSERPSWHKTVFCVETRTMFRNLALRDNKKMRSYIAKEGAIEGLVVFRLQKLKAQIIL